MAVQEIRQYYNNFEVWHSKYKNMTFLAHHHTEFEIIRVSVGSAEVVVNNVAFSLKQGDILLCQSGNIHYSEHLNGNNELEFILINPSLIQSRSAPLALETQHITAEGLEKFNLKTSAEKFFMDISRELEAREPFYENVIQNSLRCFLYLLMRYFPNESANKTIAGVKSLPFISDALSYMEAHFSENLSLEQVAKSVNIEAGYFSRVFKKYVGLNFVAYRNLIRLKNAITLLQETDTSITDIAFGCGFQNIRTFNRVFAQYTQKSPIEFRKNKELDCPITIYPHQKNTNFIMVENDSPVVNKNLHLSGVKK